MNQIKSFSLAASIILAMAFTFTSCSSDDGGGGDEMIRKNYIYDDFDVNDNEGVMGNYSMKYTCSETPSPYSTPSYHPNDLVVTDTLYIDNLIQGNLYTLTTSYVDDVFGYQLEDLFERNKEISKKSLCECLNVSNYEYYNFGVTDFDCAAFMPFESNYITEGYIQEGRIFLIKSYEDYQIFRINSFPEFDSYSETGCRSAYQLDISYTDFSCN
jgi:hypothetical protein